MVFGEQSLQGYDSYRPNADGVWVKTFPGITALGHLEKIQHYVMTDLLCEPEHFKGRIIFMLMCNDSVWQAKGQKEQCEYNKRVANHARKLKTPRGHWSFLERGSEEMWYGTYTDKPDGSWDRMAEEMKANFSRSGHISCLQCFWEENYEAKKGERSQYTWMVATKSRVASPHSDFCEETQYLRSNSRFIRRSTQAYQGSGETCSTWAFGTGGNTSKSSIGSSCSRP